MCSFQNGEKQPALNDRSSESKKLEHLLAQQNQSITSYFNQWIVGKQLFQVTFVCDYGHRFIAKLDSQQSFADIKSGDVTKSPPRFTFGA